MRRLSKRQFERRLALTRRIRLATNQSKAGLADIRRRGAQNDAIEHIEELRAKFQHETLTESGTLHRAPVLVKVERPAQAGVRARCGSESEWRRYRKCGGIDVPVHRRIEAAQAGFLVDTRYGVRTQRAVEQRQRVSGRENNWGRGRILLDSSKFPPSRQLANHTFVIQETLARAERQFIEEADRQRLGHVDVGDRFLQPPIVERLPTWTTACLNIAVGNHLRPGIGHNARQAVRHALLHLHLKRVVSRIPIRVM
jgi:hypothetical protein